jgi:hypothetical protein
MDTRKIVTIAIAAVVVLVAGIWGWRTFAPKHAPTGSNAVPGQYGGPTKADRRKAAEAEEARGGIYREPPPQEAKEENAPETGNSGG